MGDNFFFKFFGFLTLPFRFPLAVVSSTVLVPMLAAVNSFAVIAGTVAIKSFNKADQRNIDPDFLGLIDFSKYAFRGLVKFGTYPLPEIISAEQSGSVIDRLNSNLLKASGVSDNKKIDIAGNEKITNHTEVEIEGNERSNISPTRVTSNEKNPNTAINQPVSATPSLQPRQEIER